LLKTTEVLRLYNDGWIAWMVRVKAETTLHARTSGIGLFRFANFPQQSHDGFLAVSYVSPERKVAHVLLQKWLFKDPLKKTFQRNECSHIKQLLHPRKLDLEDVQFIVGGDITRRKMVRSTNDYGTINQFEQTPKKHSIENEYMVVGKLAPSPNYAKQSVKHDFLSNQQLPYPQDQTSITGKKRPRESFETDHYIVPSADALELPSLDIVKNKWTPDDVCSWLSKLIPSNPEVLRQFKDQDVDGRTLLTLTDSDLCSDKLNVNLLGPRKNILNYIAKCNNA